MICNCAVYDGWGNRVKSPKHIVVMDMMGNTSCKIASTQDSGLKGFLERMLPPFTSTYPVTRDQQIYALMAFVGVGNYKFIVDLLGGCPSLTFISMEPETLKSDTSKQGQLLFGDTGFMFSSTSSDPAIENAQCHASWVTVHDDAECSK